jgi:hypothetical protein
MVLGTLLKGCITANMWAIPLYPHLCVTVQAIVSKICSLKYARYVRSARSACRKRGLFPTQLFRDKMAHEAINNTLTSLLSHIRTEMEGLNFEGQ